MKPLISLFIITLCLSASVCRAADQDSLSAKYIIALHPFTIFANGIKFEVERRQPGSHLSFAISPELYFGTIENAKNNILINANRDSIEVFGYGGSFTTRLYVNNNFKRGDTQNPISNFYLFGSFEVRRFGLDYTGRTWVVENENGIEIYRLKNIPQHNDITRIGVNFGFGNTIFFGDNFFIDAMLYARISKSFQNPNTIENVPFTDSFFTQKGNSFGFGFRFGLLFD
ncbi:MAG: hypothetical protein JST20_06310 [Bacteroidetes bacterium]|nr:hypothetical protein [Bacteroidota bacterium]